MLFHLRPNAISVLVEEIEEVNATATAPLSKARPTSLPKKSLSESKKEIREIKARRDQLILDHLPLVSAIASHVQKSLPVHIEMDDLVHAGTMGLFDAATKYRDDKEVAFRTYAKHRIRGAILDSLRQQDWASRDLRKRYRQVESIRADLSAKLQREPNEVDMAEAMGLSLRRWQSLLVDFRSLGLAASQLQASEREDGYVSEAAAGPANAPDKVFAREELKAKLLVAMKSLPERYKQVVELYYIRDLTMKEIGGMLGVNESRVSQIHKSALERMQIVLKDGGIQSPSAFFSAA
jgi:RNA polymerase sigma factor for flagellar operon FliA